MAEKEYAKQEEYLKGTFSQWVRVTTLHGVADWFANTSLIGRVVWGVVLSLCTVMLVLQVGVLVADFVASPHYETNLYQKDEPYSAFPNVTVCNFNRVNKTKAEEINITREAVAYLYKSFLTMYDIDHSHYYPIPGSSPLAQAWFEYKNRSKTDPTIETDPKVLLSQLAHDCSASIRHCSFGGRQFDCCRHATKVLNMYGLCYSLALPKKPEHDRPRQYFSGLSTGLKLYMLPFVHDAYDSNLLFNNYAEAGMVVVINYTPYDPVVRRAVPIAPGSHVWIGLKNKLGFSANAELHIWDPGCLKNPKMQYLKGGYNVEKCYTDCSLKLMHQQCGCVVIAETVTNFTTCDPYIMESCVLPKTVSMFLSEEDNPLKQCFAERCLPSCDVTREVDLSISATEFPGKHVKDTLAEFVRRRLGIHAEDAKEMIVVDAYFVTRQHLYFEKREKTPLSDLVSNIGGQMGLWCGMSVVTLVQAIYYTMKGYARRASAKHRQLAKAEQTRIHGSTINAIIGVTSLFSRELK